MKLIGNQKCEMLVSLDILQVIWIKHSYTVEGYDSENILRKTVRMF